ncbi:hypothetical protein COU80_05730 [Candidatus Peregrinibacteria bacterium CG10_big_fil_rev_8_21_14_0_10_55_24]|nr:MAG: hypothetical protein COU80_05730 [Candidatus Peregrinibacteria bacterium CG10_big_fil_rev_8_21_14_0_10_55_24]
MRERVFILFCGITTILLCIPLAKDLPLSMALADPVVRARAPQAVESLRRRGLWLVNTELTGIERNGESVCFHWVERYRNRTQQRDAKPITTCF